ncbi:uncharacterized protein LOC135228263 [Loxodonta africana]|uniref:uncharacterized protein LOC135228263 n=1 Tax=Loxodonta africana TaxID=9785 RepID=UPI0030CB1B2A
MYSNDDPSQTVVYSEESNTTVSYTQKITSPLPTASSTGPPPLADVRTPFLQENYMQDSQTRRISTLKLTHSPDLASSSPFNPSQLSKSAEVPSFPRRPFPPPPDTVPETHTASLSIQIAPLSGQGSEGRRQLPDLSPETAKIPLQQERQKSAVAAASQPSDGRVVPYTFQSLLTGLLEGPSLTPLVWASYITECFFRVLKQERKGERNHLPIRRPIKFTNKFGGFFLICRSFI